MGRALTVQNLYDKKFKTFDFTDTWETIFGKPSTTGIWLLYGKDKNGKTWGTLLIADYLSTFEKLLYVSAEEGTDMEFQAALKRANIDSSNKNIHFIEYEPFEDLKERLRKHKSAKIVIIDNLTMYSDEIKAKDVKELKQEFKNKLFIFLAHEERNEPYTAAAQMAKKLAKVIMRVKGLVISVGGRVPGGNLLIDKEKAMLYHGTEISNN